MIMTKLRIFFGYLSKRLLIVKNLATAKIKSAAAQISKTAIAILSAAILLFIISLSVSGSWRFFCSEHPGIVIVAFAVLGEIVCDWKRRPTFLEWVKMFFGFLLVAGLCIEMIEAIKADHKVEELRQRNDTLEMLRQDRGYFVAPHVLAAELIGRPKIKTEILYEKGDEESYGLADRIAMGLKSVSWEVAGPRPAEEQDAVDFVSVNGVIFLGNNGDFPGRPITSRLGAGTGQIAIFLKNPPPLSEFSNTNNAVGAFIVAFNDACKWRGVPSPPLGPFPAWQDKLLTNDVMRIVVGKKPW